MNKEGRRNTHREDIYPRQDIYGKGTEMERRKEAYRREDIYGKKTYRGVENVHTRRGETHKEGTHT